MQRSFGKYLWENIRRLMKFCEQISVVVQRSVSQYQQTRRDLRANISRRAKICCGQISVDGQRYVGKYHNSCKDLVWANISRCAKISDLRSLGKYQQTCKDLLANIRRCAKICKNQQACTIFGQISVDVQRSMGKYQHMCEDLHT